MLVCLILLCAVVVGVILGGRPTRGQRQRASVLIGSARYRRAVLPHGVESVDESSRNDGDGQDEVVAYRKLSPAQQMFLERPALATMAPRRLRLEPQSQPLILR